MEIEKINQKLAFKAKEVELARQTGELDIVKLSEIYYPDDELTKFLVKEKGKNGEPEGIIDHEWIWKETKQNKGD